MKLLLLGGNSVSNRTWIEEVETKVRDLFEETKILYYDHWTAGREIIEFESERKKLSKLVEGWDDYLVFAKSVGTLLTLAGTEDGVLKPKAALLCGFPRGFADQIGYTTVDSAWSSVNYSVTLFQNEADPVGSYDEVARYLEKIETKINLVKTPGNTHGYENYEQIRDYLMKLLG